MSENCHPWLKGEVFSRCSPVALFRFNRHGSGGLEVSNYDKLMINNDFLFILDIKEMCDDDDDDDDLV